MAINDTIVINKANEVIKIDFTFLFFLFCACDSPFFHSHLNFIEKNKKRDIRNWYQSANDRYNDAVEDKNRDTLRRGDIPILHGDCDGKFIPTFYFLI